MNISRFFGGIGILQRRFYSGIGDSKDTLNEFQLFAEQSLLKPFAKLRKTAKPRAIHAPTFPEESQQEKLDILPDKKFMPSQGDSRDFHVRLVNTCIP